MNNYLKYIGNSIRSGHNTVWILMILVAVVISMLPVCFFGIPSGNDLTQHFQFAKIYHEAILSGNFFPNWSAFENYGYGGIGIRFYPPLGYYALAIAKILTGSWFDAAWLTFLFWMFVGCLGIYFWAKEFFSTQVSGVAGILYAFSPFHLVQIYQFWIYAEFVASAILPFCFLFVIRVCRRGKFSDILGLAIAYALLVLSHIPLTLIGSISLLIYAVTILEWRNPSKQILKLTISVLLGLFASSFHWIRIITEMSWLNHASPDFSSGLYSYHEYFFPFHYHLKPTWNFWTTYMGLLLFVSTFAILSVLIPFIFLILKSKTAPEPLKMFRGAILTGLFAFLMATPLSIPIWQIFPVLQKVQFPWRWFAVVVMVGVISLAGLAVPFIQTHKTKRWVNYSTLIFSFCLLFFVYTQIIIPSAPIPRATFETQISNLLNEKSFICWWTIWAKEEAINEKNKVSIDSREVSVIRWDKEIREFEINAGTAGNARVATFYYPYWRSEINGIQTEVKMGTDGEILIPVPAEKTHIKLYFEPPIYTRSALVISLLIWLFVFCGLGFIILKRKNTKQ